MYRYDNQDFRYDTLPSSDFIRVLTLYPAPHMDSPVFGDMSVRPLRRNSHYAALSYSWGMNVDGDTSASHFVTISGASVPVTKNLFEALQRLRNTLGTQPVWIDAICINQDDISERNAQVAQMAKVYKFADRVIAWLGEGTSTEADRSALALLKCLQWECRPHRCPSRQHHCAFVSALWTFGSPATSHDEASSNAQHRRSSKRPPELDTLPSSFKFRHQVGKMAQILLEFLNRRYFSRRWIVQELYHPVQEKITFAWGPCQYPVEKLIVSLDRLQAFLETVRRAWLTMDRFYPVMREDPHRLSQRYLDLMKLEGLACDIYNMLQMKIPDKAGLTLYNALHRCSKFRCSDARDIPFALISLDPEFGLIPDYSLSLVETYIAFAKIMVAKGLVAILLHNLRETVNIEHKADRIDLPTWVPDLRHGFVDEKAPGSLLQGTVTFSNVIGAELYVIGRVNPDIQRTTKVISNQDRDAWGDLIYQQRLATAYTVFWIDRQAPNQQQQYHHRRWSLSNIRFRKALELWVSGHGTASAGTAAALQPGDLVCAVQSDWWVTQDELNERPQDSLSPGLPREEWRNRKDRINDLVLLRASRDDRSVYNVVRVFSAEELKFVHYSHRDGKTLARFTSRETIFLG